MVARLTPDQKVASSILVSVIPERLQKFLGVFGCGRVESAAGVGPEVSVFSAKKNCSAAFHESLHWTCHICKEACCLVVAFRIDCCR